MPRKLDPALRAANKKRSDAAWYARNRDKRLAYWRDRYRRNVNRCRERTKAYYEAHRDECLQRKRDWERANREAIKVRKHLGVSIAEARLLLAAIPSRNGQQQEVRT